MKCLLQVLIIDGDEKRIICCYCPVLNRFYIASISHCRFGQKFVDRVANPRDIVLFQRRKPQPRKTGDTTIGKVGEV